MGGGAGGSDFDPHGKSDAEVMGFCQSFMAELYRHIGPETDTPAGDIGVGAREIGYLFGMYRKLRNEFTGVLTGKGLGWGGSLIRLEAAGYGCVYFAAEMLATRNNTLEGKACLVSGSGKVAQFITEKLIELGANVLTLSDSSGYIYDEEGIDRDKLEFVKQLKNVKRGRISEYADKYPRAVYTDADNTLDYNPLWNHPANCAFPAATENEIREKDAYNLINNRISIVCEGANMPCTAEAVEIIQGKGDILYATFLDWPGEKAVIKTIAAENEDKGGYPGFYKEEIKRISLLGDGQELKWSLTRSGLVVEMPEEKPCDHAYVIKIERYHHPKLK